MHAFDMLQRAMGVETFEDLDRFLRYEAEAENLVPRKVRVSARCARRLLLPPAVPVVWMMIVTLTESSNRERQENTGHHSDHLLGPLSAPFSAPRL
jgi:hypothetical protein